MSRAEPYRPSPRIVVTTAPFAQSDPTPVERLTAAGIPWRENPTGRRLRAHEVAGLIGEAEVVIAGTEPIGADVLAACPRLRAICRVGIGLDNIDLLAARKQGVAVSYTPDAPAPAVAELTVGLIIDLMRGVTGADRQLRAGTWERRAGRRIGASVIGVIGVGRIGGRVIRHLTHGFPGVRVLANDLTVRPADAGFGSVEWADKERIFREADLITLHIPLTPDTRGLVGAHEIGLMKPGALLVNTARGSVIVEEDVVAALETGHLGGAAIDVFAEEPYQGPLTRCERAVLTCHIGSMTADCRARMEIEATEEAIRILNGMPPLSSVPEEEYHLQAMRYAMAPDGL